MKVILSFGSYLRNNAPNPLKSATYSKYGNHLFYATSIAGTALYGWPFAAAALGAWGARYAWNRYNHTAQRRNSQNSSSSALSADEDELISEAAKRVLPPVEYSDLAESNERPSTGEEFNSEPLPMLPPLPEQTEAQLPRMPPESNPPLPDMPAEAEVVRKASTEEKPEEESPSKTSAAPVNFRTSIKKLSKDAVETIRADKKTNRFVRFINRKAVSYATELLLADPKVENHPLNVNMGWIVQKLRDRANKLKRINVKYWFRLAKIKATKSSQKRTDRIGPQEDSENAQ